MPKIYSLFKRLFKLKKLDASRATESSIDSNTTFDQNKTLNSPVTDQPKFYNEVVCEKKLPSQEVQKDVGVVDKHGSLLPLMETALDEIHRNKVASPQVSGSLGKLQTRLPDYQLPSTGFFGQENHVGSDFSKYLLPVCWGSSGDMLEYKDLNDIRTLLIFGAPCTGKTSFLHQLIASILITKRPDEVKFILADIKGLEFDVYSTLQNLFLAKSFNIPSIIEQPAELSATMSALKIEIEKRFEKLRIEKVRSYEDYVLKFAKQDSKLHTESTQMPFLVVIIDDLESFCLVDKSKITSQISAVIEDGYKVGVLVIISSNDTSKQSAAALLLPNIEKRVSFRQIARSDFRRIFDGTNAFEYLDNGEFIYNKYGHVYKSKIANPDLSYLTEIVHYIESQEAFDEPYFLPASDVQNENYEFALHSVDPLLEDAARLVIQSQSGSTSLLQRRFKLGYNRAGRLIDQMEALGIVGPGKGGGVRDVIVKGEKELKTLLSKR